ncbi:hypothetical protein RND71_010649 [Anisodus tanguticus]|uniref:Uncharacterized protein n=1 Tax=Anisodus tanguticus TaxID=243964 RepID=A0AAE1SI53_9SOLA|nr:hypothetical protein RND71_010649 [Anisodus tanguticus]
MEQGLKCPTLKWMALVLGSEGATAISNTMELWTKQKLKAAIIHLTCKAESCMFKMRHTSNTDDMLPNGISKALEGFRFGKVGNSGLGMAGISSFGNFGNSCFGNVGNSGFGISGNSGFGRVGSSGFGISWNSSLGKVGISGRCGNSGLGSSGLVTSRRWRASP